MELVGAGSEEYADAQYGRWKSDPSSVPRDWAVFFEGFELGLSRETAAPGGLSEEETLRQCRAESLIQRYRDVGHLLACLDPLAPCPVDHPLLNLAAFGLAPADLDHEVFAPGFSDRNRVSLRLIVEALRETYCRSLGVEYTHLQDPGERGWLRDRMEPTRNRPDVGRPDRLRILELLTRATLFEEFLHRKYLGQTRFSLEGAEAMIPLVDGLLRHGASLGWGEAILGSAHRGRLNLQVHILGQSYEEVFCEFESNYNPETLTGGGDVKYHKGLLSDVKGFDGGTLRLFLPDNPSHLEAVDPVVEGIARARQDRLGHDRRAEVLPILIHGDAAIAGQGIVAETLNLSQLEGYRTGGTVHLVVNNQIGYTTVAEDARSTRYATDVAKMLMVPIFHVHGENPEAVLHVARLACDYRARFAKDVVIDVVCYRRYGHNEGDEPYFTQPQMYDRIRDRKPLYRLYGEALLERGDLGQAELDAEAGRIRSELDAAFDAARAKPRAWPLVRHYEEWQGVGGPYTHESTETAVGTETLLALAGRLNAPPDGFQLHPKLAKLLERRREAVEQGQGIDWANAESLAFASLLAEGTPVRLSGEDSRRGTFSQRHSVWVDVATGRHWAPLANLSADQGSFWAYDSLLSEAGVLGFEYGYSLASPRCLVLWEAQYGDFADGAQVIIDEFVASGEAKWQRPSGLVLLLPHGYEGQGPDHSTARPERFLQLCAEDNLQVCNPSTPAQYFHLLRRQMRRGFRKPLVVLTPKSLLRHPKAVSALGDLASGTFREVLADEVSESRAKRVLLCSGKIFFELLEKRDSSVTAPAALVRLEQLYPFPEQAVAALRRTYRQAAEWVWVQEEPENMGAWTFVKPRLEAALGREVRYVGRPAAASPATGFLSIHKLEQAAILDQALGKAVRVAKRSGGRPSGRKPKPKSTRTPSRRS